MNLTDEITIRAPFVKIFAVAANLPRWPEFLPHYRSNRFISQTPSGGIVRMSCVSSRINVTWISEFRIDPANRQLHFVHRKSTLNATRGMKVTWDFEEETGGFVHVAIHHQHDPKWAWIGPGLTSWVAGRFFIRDIAGRTLAGLKHKVEAQEYLAAIPR
jgi:ribosome-associated toxin RatA of RatAB toxin-antitoxin module